MNVFSYETRGFIYKKEHESGRINKNGLNETEFLKPNINLGALLYLKQFS